MKMLQRKRIIHISVLLSWIVSLILTPLSGNALAREATGQADKGFAPVQTRPALQFSPVADPDFDGIPSAVETAGWYNSAGGPYLTNPDDPDSDNDGLLDGQEQLYDTDPLDNKSPGMYVEYQENFYTKKYWPWQRHGSKFIVHGQLSPSNKDILVRRGNTFFVGGPPNATLTVQESIASLTDLIPVKNSCGGGWTIAVPSNGTVGKYTLNLQEGGWSQTMSLYVIFDLPTDLSGPEVAAYLYSDDLADKRDEFSAWLDTSYETNYGPTYNYYAWSYAFATEQYTRKVFEDYVIDTINGKDKVKDAFEALAHKVDSVTRFDAGINPNNMTAALKSDELRNHCTGIASVAVGFLRSAGIASRPIVSDWQERHYDTSTEAWIGVADSQGDKWRTVRAWNNSGESNSLPTSPFSQTVTGGIFGPKTRYDFGHSKYTAGDAAIISTMGPNWNWTEVRNSVCGFGAFKKVFQDFYLPEQGNESPAQAPGNIDHVAGWLSQTKPYWGWPSEPTTEQLLSYPCVPSGGASLTSQEVTASAQPVAFSTQNVPTRPELARFGKVIADYGVDTNGNGRYEQLVLEVEVEVNQPGNYTIIGRLNDSTPTPLTVNGDMATASNYTYLAAGKQVVKLEFRGQTIYENGEDGAYTLSELWLSDLEYPEDIDLDSHAVDYLNSVYQTAVYSREGFENGGARLSGSYSHTPVDTNGDGYYDRLTINTGLNINTPGEYRVEGELVDATGEVVATASWIGANDQVELQFEVLLGDTTPYYLNNVYLYDPAGSIIESETTYEPGAVGPGIYTISPLYDLGLSATAVTTPTVTTATPVDTDSDGDYDQLDFAVNAAIAVGGDYRLEGWLESATGALIALETSDPVVLTPGSHTLTLSFPGQTINAFKANGPYQLVALKVLQGVYTVIDEVKVAYKTSAYSFENFDGNQSGDIVLYDEGTTNNWNMGATTWGLTNFAAYSPLYSWTDSPNVNYNSTDTMLTSKSITISNGAAPTISFKTCYDINTDGDQGKIELKAGATDWTPVTGAAYEGATNGWASKEVLVPPIVGANNMEFRFLMDANTSSHADGWYVDDTLVTLNYDLDNDGIGNAIEADPDGNGVADYPDTDNDGTPDYLDTDSDGDGIPDETEGSGDPDHDSLANYRDTDSDGDGIPDQVEAGPDPTHPIDTDGDHIPDYLDNDDPNGDADGDGILNTDENIPGHDDADGDGIWNVADPDSDNDGIPDSVEAGDSNLATPPVDTDFDGLPNFIDPDSDNDSIPDEIEGIGDPDHDGIPNYLDLDSDGDGMPDEWEWFYGFNPKVDDSGADADSDGLTNGEEYAQDTHPLNPDTDGDGFPDGTDLNPGQVIYDIFLPVILKK